MLSPSLILAHEMDHGVGYALSPLDFYHLYTHAPTHDDLDRLEEERVITGLSHWPKDAQALRAFSAGDGIENRAAQYFGELVRKAHRGDFIWPHNLAPSEPNKPKF